MFNKILIANRGEVAVRVARTIRAMNIEPVFVYSEQDSLSAYARSGDEFYVLPGNRVQDTYLNKAAILSIARRAAVDAIHPGYGLMSEDPGFAESCENEGIVFIGPHAGAMSTMASKLTARAVAAAQGVPLLPAATVVQVESGMDELATAIGYPVVVKAAAGGGGIGMRVVPDGRSLAAALVDCSATGAAYFGNPEVYIEKYIAGARHIEAQVLADKHGTIGVIGERECSIQRRYQKFIEESPAPSLTPDVRDRIAGYSARLAAAVGYDSLGTVEYIVDENGSAYFLEMNTRLQVEHGVTEAVYGCDLVEQQIRASFGELLSLSGLSPTGHAIEARIYAEDSLTGVPSPGRLTTFELPFGYDHVRVDSAAATGDEVSIFYDPLLAKVIAWGKDRPSALVRLDDALRNTRIEGVKTNLDLGRAVLASDAFACGEYSTTTAEEVRQRLAIARR